MKSLLLSFSLLFLSVFVYATNVEPGNKKINVTQSNIGWKGYKFTKSHEGTLKFKSGNLEFKGNQLVGGEMVVDMTTLTNTDMAAGSGKEKLEGHLKSEDFFGVEKYPTASIKFTKVTANGIAGEYQITANVTIKNKTKEIKFTANVKDGNANAVLKLDRSDFDVRFGSGKFFDNLGDKAISDEFDLNVSMKY